MNKSICNTNMVNKLQELSYKMDNAKNKMFFVHEATQKLEQLAVKFDKQEEGSAHWLAYEYSRVYEPFMFLLSGISNDIINTERDIDEIINQLTKAEAVEKP